LDFEFDHGTFTAEREIKINGCLVPFAAGQGVKYTAKKLALVTRNNVQPRAASQHRVLTDSPNWPQTVFLFYLRN